MHMEPIPYEQQLGAELPTQLPNEANGLAGADVAVVDREEQANVSLPRRYGQRADDTQPVKPIPAPMHWRLAARRPRSPHQRLQHEAALVDQDDRAVLTTSLFLSPSNDGYENPRRQRRCA